MTANLRGSLIMVLSMALFAIEDMFLKWLTVAMPIGQILLVSGFFGMVFFAIVARAQGLRTFTRDAGDNDLFDEPKVEGANRVEGINQVVGISMRRRIAQGAERIQGTDGFLCLVRAVHALRLVNDDNRIGRANEFNRLAPRQFVGLFENDVALLLVFSAGEILAERINVDDENLNLVADRELAQAVHFLRVVNEFAVRRSGRAASRS